MTKEDGDASNKIKYNFGGEIGRYSALISTYAEIK